MPAIDTTKNFAALPESDANLIGASGDGNDPSKSDLQRGFSRVEAQSPLSGLYAGLGIEQGGFLGRPHGWER